MSLLVANEYLSRITSLSDTSVLYTVAYVLIASLQMFTKTEQLDFTINKGEHTLSRRFVGAMNLHTQQRFSPRKLLFWELRNKALLQSAHTGALKHAMINIISKQDWKLCSKL